MNTRILIIGLGIVAAVLAAFFLFRGSDVPETEYVAPQKVLQQERVIGHSAEGRDITAATFGDGGRHLLFVGGMHGGYEWNSVLLAYRFVDYFEKDATRVPADTRVTIIPVLNPDGLFAVVGKIWRFSEADVPEEFDARVGRFNANSVDLNRNFDCKWQPESSWKGETVSAGTEAFSEPEAQVLRDFVLAEQPDAVVFWHSAADAVYASECEDGILPATRALMTSYATAAGYKAIDTFDAYPITGDAEGWLASIGVPAITVELSTHDALDWEENVAGVEAVLGLNSH